MIKKTSIRFYNNKPVRSRFDFETLSWLMCAVDLIGAIVETNNINHLYLKLVVT